MDTREDDEAIKEKVKADMLLSILKKAHPIIRHKHISCDVLYKNFPSHLKGIAKTVRDELITDGILIKRPSNKKGYWKCSLDHKRLDEILSNELIINNVKNDEFLKKRIERNYKREIT